MRFWDIFNAPIQDIAWITNHSANELFWTIWIRYPDPHCIQMFVIQIPTVQNAHNEKEFTHALKSRQVNVTWPDRTLIKRHFFTLEEKDGVFELLSKISTVIKRHFLHVTGKGRRFFAWGQKESQFRVRNLQLSNDDSGTVEKTFAILPLGHWS